MFGLVKLTFANGTFKGLQRAFRRPGQAVIGRADDCELKLPDLLEFMPVSRHHCLLIVDPPEVRIRDLNSRNGTYVNGVPLGEAGPGAGETRIDGITWRRLKDGDEIRLGGTYLKVDIVAAEGYYRAGSRLVEQVA